MSGKKKIDYKAVFQVLLDILPRPPAVKELVLDFEAAVWLAARDILPQIQLRGCSFHWAQAVWRKVQHVGLQAAYSEDADMHKIIKMLLALPFPPAEHIPPAFTYLQGKAATDQLSELMRYVETAWINGRIWRPRSWSIYQQSVRTNNDVEG